MRNTGEGAKPPLRYSLNLSAHFRVWVTVWVTVWVRRLTHILTHTIFSVFATKKHRKPKFSMLFGAAGQIRTADLILTNRSKAIQPLLYKAFWAVFCPKRMRSQPVCSVISVRSFPRVGHGVGRSPFTVQIRIALDK